MSVRQAAFGLGVLAVLLCVTLQASASLEHVQMHSIFPPILADYWENGLHYWSFGSSSVVTDEYVRLTTNSPTAKGFFWNRHPNQLQSFVANTTLRLKSRGAGWFADATDGGFAVWYTASTPRHMPTQFFGNVDTFDGLGLILDHTDTLSILIGDGDRSVQTISRERRGFCNIKQLVDNKVTISVKYNSESKELLVTYNVWQSAHVHGADVLCSVVNDVALPLRNYFGVTASNSVHAQAEHDLFSFFVKPLHKSDAEDATREEEAAGDHLFDREREQRLQKEWNGRADEPLSKERPPSGDEKEVSDKKESSE